ncbi:MAG: M20/M25/M40 family metallo-hydrolase, partial [Actinomycetota bacterium]
MNHQERIRKLVAQGSSAHIEMLAQACAIPSVSAEGTGLVEMSAWLEERLKTLGFSVDRLSVPGSADALLAELPGPGERTLMIYDHYDVQPVDPIELWESPPFELTERDGRLFARGAADNKGDLIARLRALELYREVYGDFPFSIKFFIEGEEESGSVNFHEICQTYADRLAADDCVWEGAWIDLDGRPSMHFGCKGLLYLELTRKLLSGDQHSSIAVYAPSAAWEMLEAVASMKDAEGHITIEGFHDALVTPSAQEKELIEGLVFN